MEGRQHENAGEGVSGVAVVVKWDEVDTGDGRSRTIQDRQSSVRRPFGEKKKILPKPAETP